jgi:hypothetical protein
MPLCSHQTVVGSDRGSGWNDCAVARCNGGRGCRKAGRGRRTCGQDSGPLKSYQAGQGLVLSSSLCSPSSLSLCLSVSVAMSQSVLRSLPSQQSLFALITITTIITVCDSPLFGCFSCHFFLVIFKLFFLTHSHARTLLFRAFKGKLVPAARLAISIGHPGKLLEIFKTMLRSEFESGEVKSKSDLRGLVGSLAPDELGRVISCVLPLCTSDPPHHSLTLCSALRDVRCVFFAILA